MFKDKTKTFFTLKRFQFHSSMHDMSLLRDALTYNLFREMGVPTVCSTHCVVMLKIGDELVRAGVYLVTELLDGRFTEAFYPGGDGNLYKEAWPGFATAADYDIRLRTNAAGLEEDQGGSEAFHSQFSDHRGPFLIPCISWALYLRSG